MTMEYDTCIYLRQPWVELVLPVEGTTELLDEINRLTDNKIV